MIVDTKYSVELPAARRYLSPIAGGGPIVLTNHRHEHVTKHVMNPSIVDEGTTAMSTLRFAGMLRRRLDLTTALRPTLDPDEALLFLQDGVGLYEGCVSTSSRFDLR